MSRKNQMKKKKGFSLVEVVASAAILCVVAIAVIGSIGAARQSVLSNTAKESAAASAQAIADTLMAELSVSQTPDAAALETLTGAKKVASFSAENGEKQFAYEHVASGVKGYRIRVVVYYGNGRNSVAMSAFAAESSEEYSSDSI